jgi:hypothetical protein
MIVRHYALSLVLGLVVLGLGIAAEGVVAPASAQAPSRSSGDWVVPRTDDGHPDLQGNWSNSTLTPLQRPKDQEAVLTWEQASAIEQGRADVVITKSQRSDPDRRPAGPSWSASTRRRDATTRSIPTEVSAWPS